MAKQHPQSFHALWEQQRALQAEAYEKGQKYFEGLVKCQHNVWHGYTRYTSGGYCVECRDAKGGELGNAKQKWRAKVAREAKAAAQSDEVTTWGTGFPGLFKK